MQEIAILNSFGITAHQNVILFLNMHRSVGVLFDGTHASKGALD
jgi:ABC-type lipoprotein release transport system permease subunit